MSGLPQEMNYYRVFGLDICADVALPLQSIEPRKVDLTIESGSVPHELDNVFFSRATYDLSQKAFLYTLPDIARYHVSNGDSIRYELLSSDVADLRLFQSHMLGTVMAAILHQRGLCVLHASAVSFNGQAVLFSGKSGIGKSTLCSALYAKGYDFISDDISVIHQIDGELKLAKGYPFSRLWDDSLDSLSLSASELEATVKSKNKFILPVKQAEAEFYAIKSIVFLDVDPYKKLGIEAVKGGRAVDLLGSNIYRKTLCRELHGPKGFLEKLIALANLDIQLLHRDYEGWDLHGLTQLLEKRYG